MITEPYIINGMRSDHVSTKIDRDIRRLLDKELLEDFDRFYWIDLTSPTEQRNQYDGTRFDQ